LFPIDDLRQIARTRIRRICGSDRIILPIRVLEDTD